MNLAKCLFLKRELEYLGYQISASGITLNPRHVKAILNFLRPKNVKQVQSFLGITNYFRRFIKDYSLHARSLQSLLKKEAVFHFAEECVESFERLKLELTTSPVLYIYNHAAETGLHTDASSLGFGVILLQKQRNGGMAPIAYFSKVTSDTESKYHNYELEMLAIVRAIERFHMNVQGISFKIVTDCNFLVLAMRKININPRIARWTLALQNYHFEMIHRPEDRIKHVDYLSRSIMLADITTLEDELIYKQLSDPRLREIAE